METPFTFLVPLSFLLIWSMFSFSSSAVTSLVTLLFSSLLLPALFMSSMKEFWPCGLFLILMSTGLLVVFAYIVSLHSQEWRRGEVSGGFCLGVIFTLMVALPLPKLSQKIFLSSTSISAGMVTSLSLLFLLLFLVVSFIRIVYSKGGGFRKKF